MPTTSALPTGANATFAFESPQFAASLGTATRRLLAGRPVRLYVVGGSASAGAGGIGVNRTFDARLAAKINAALAKTEASSGRTLGRVVRTSVAQGGTTSFWSGLMAEALHGRRVAKHFAGHGRFEGEVTQCDDLQAQTYTVRYDDGDGESQLPLAEVLRMLLPVRSGARKKRKRNKAD